MKNRWWLAASLVLSLGLTPLALAQEGKTGGMEGEHMMEQKGDAMKDQGRHEGFGCHEGRRGQDGKALRHEQMRLGDNESFTFGSLARKRQGSHGPRDGHDLSRLALVKECGPTQTQKKENGRSLDRCC